jgi:hypothetical protein
MAGNAITLDDITTLINDELNLMSDALFASGDITRDITFEISADHLEEPDKTYSTSVVTPGVTKIDSPGEVAPSQQFAQITNTIKLYIKGFHKDLSDLKQIINQYYLDYSGFQNVIDTWRVQRTYNTPLYSDVYIDDGEDRINIELTIDYLFMFNGVMSDDVTIKVNELELPILSFSHTIEKQGASDEIITKPNVNSSWFTTRNNAYSMSFRYLKDNDTMLEIVEDIKTGQFLNRKYCIEYDDGQFNDRLTMLLSNGTISYTVGGFLTIQATFIEAMPGLES